MALELEDEFDRKLESITSDLPQQYSRMLLKIQRKDALTIINYMISLNSEVNPAVSYRRSVMKCLTGFIAFSRHIDIKQLERKDVLAFLDSKRKSEIADPLINGLEPIICIGVTCCDFSSGCIHQTSNLIRGLSLLLFKLYNY
jgi:hypothetical protein